MKKKKKRDQTADGRKVLACQEALAENFAKVSPVWKVFETQKERELEGRRSVTGRGLARYDRMIEIVTRREHRLQRKVHELDERYQIQMRALTQQLKEAARKRHELESQQREAEHTYDRETAGVGL